MEVFTVLVIGFVIYAIKVKIDAINAEKIAKKQVEEHSRKQAMYYRLQSKYSDGISKLTNHLIGLKTQYIANADVVKLECYRVVIDELNAIPKLYRHDSTACLLTLWEECTRHRDLTNQAFVEREIESCKQLLDGIDGYDLDIQQRTAVVTDEDNNLVIAGAGSGKTLTIAGKVKYLVGQNGVDPSQILLMSFTRKSANEMKERINNRLCINVRVETFHSLGLKLIAEATNVKPSVESNSADIVRQFFNSAVENGGSLAQDILLYYSQYLIPILKREDNDTAGEYYEKQRLRGMTPIKVLYQKQLNKETLNAEYVKSIEELIIANFLFVNGIEYQYEPKYPHPTASKNYSQYKPDFYLVQKGVYLEHFGLNKHGEVPWLDDVHEQIYLEGIRWKRQTHRQNRTTLVETYSYYHSEGRLLEELTKVLEQQGYTLNPLSNEEIIEVLRSVSESSPYKELVKLFGTFLSLFKSKGLEESDIDALTVDSYNRPYTRERKRRFLKIFRYLYRYYQSTLYVNDDIDFNDMINQATGYVSRDKVRTRYRYLIVDEFQDTSMSKFALLKAIQNQTGAKVFAVGDDWQSIYRFTGADLSLFTTFSQYFGATAELRIEQTYRNSQQLIDLAGGFVMKNTQQLKKQLRSGKRLTNPVRIVRYQENESQALVVALQSLNLAPQSRVLLLGRNNFDVEFLENTELFKIQRRNDRVFLISELFPGLSIEFMTVHKSKGLEADAVVVLNLRNSLLGFPNQIADDPLLNLLLSQQIELEYAEERRLFYVALTRTKSVVCLLSPVLKASVFLRDLAEQPQVTTLFVEGDTSSGNNIKCPTCKTGIVVLKDGRYGQFWGCEHFPSCGFKISKKPEVNENIRCPRCSYFMAKKVNRKNGSEFYGCTHYPDCTQTLPLTFNQYK